MYFWKVEVEVFQMPSLKSALQYQAHRVIYTPSKIRAHFSFNHYLRHVLFDLVLHVF